MIDVYADMFDTVHLAEETAAGQVFELAAPQLVVGIKVPLWLQHPEFTGLRGSIWTVNAAGEPAVRVTASDNAWSRSGILHGSNYGLKELFFDFQHPSGVPLAAGAYMLRLHAAQYEFSEGSHLAWVKSYPRAVYPEGLPSPTLENMPSFPRQLVVIGADFEL